MKEYNTHTVIFDHLNKDPKNFLAVVGPCSVQSLEAANAIATELVEMQKRVDPKCLIVMRVYVDKPRSCLGWRGLLYTDPHAAFRAMLECGELLPIAVEIVDPHSMEKMLDLYGHTIESLISLPTIGARTSESQTHRVAASSWMCAAGIKNPMDGDVAAFTAGCRSIYESWPTISSVTGRLTETEGNNKVIGIWRGGRGHNSVGHGTVDYLSIRRGLVSAGLDDMPLLIDLNHGNAKAIQKYVPASKRQLYVLNQAIEANDAYEGELLRGFMAECHIEEGQSLDLTQNTMSVTDYCNSLSQIEEMINLWK